MTKRNFAAIAAVVAGTLFCGDRANAQITTGVAGYATPGGYSTSAYTPTVTNSYYTTPAYYTTPYVATSSYYYTTPYYSASYYSTPYVYGSYYPAYGGTVVVERPRRWWRWY